MIYPLDPIACRRRRLPRRTGGAALLVALGVLVLLTMVVVAFLTTATAERQSAQSFSTAAKVRVLADSVVRTVMAQIREATSRGPGIAWASQPGMIRNYDDSGNAAGYAKLYSWDAMLAKSGRYDPGAAAEQIPASGTSAWFHRPNEYVDLNEPSNGRFPIADPAALDPSPGNPGTAGAYAVDEFRVVNAPANGAPGGNPLPMPVKWLYVLQDGRLADATASGAGGAVSVAGATMRNPVIGRVAFWTDDETAKVNLNTASEGVFWDVPRCYTRRTPPTDSSTRSPEFDLAYRRPLVEEYQRYPGHPATTSLSAVFGAWYPGPRYGSDQVVSNWEDVKALFELTPRYSDGGSRGGTTRTADDRSLRVARKADRLYASTDELLYKQAGRETIEPPLAADGARDLVQRARFFVTTNNRAPELNLFGRPRVTIWPVFETESKTTSAGAKPARTASDRLITFCSSLGRAADGTPHLYLFQRRDNKSRTGDVGIARNQELLAYLRHATAKPIPGFGGAFEQKWSAAERDQLLATVFDWIRTTNLNDPQLADPARDGSSRVAGTYTDTVLNQGSWHAWENDRTSPGQVIPAKFSAALGGALGASQPAMRAKGPGRIAVLESASLVFYCDARTVDAAASQPILSSATTSIRAALVFSWHHPMDGYMTVYDRFRVEVSALEGGSAISVENIAPEGQRPANYEDAAVVGDSELRFFTSGSVARIMATGAEPSDHTRRYGGSHSVFPTARGKTRAVRFTDNPSRAFETVSENAVKIRGNPGTDFTRWAFSGATFRVKIFAPDTPGGESETLIQTLTLRFPPMANLPVPGPLKAANVGYFVSDFFNETAGRPGVMSEPWLCVANGVPQATGTHGEIRRHRLEQAARSQGAVQVAGVWKDVPDLIGGEEVSINLPAPSVSDPGRKADFRLYCGDVVKSLVPIHGDFRLIACAEEVPDTVYVPLPGYNPAPGTDPVAAASSHAIRVGLGFVYPNVYTASKDPRTGFSSIGRFRRDVQWQAAGDCLPFLPPHIADLSEVPSRVPATAPGDIRWTPGDWTTAAGNNLDGAYFGHPDEGCLNSASDEGGNRPPYFGYDQQRVFANVTSPNLQVPSPVALGSLPTGVVRNRPWETLLFRPSVGSPVHPGAASPRDHLLLDLFTMPVAEPYAISEPFSTAGKVNLNYDIVPFRYIKRDAAIRAVLQNERVSAIGSAYGGLKNGGNPGTNDAHYPANIRLEIDLQETLKGFERRFQDGEIFRSATEICDLHLVPRGAAEDGMESFWRQNAMTGDNLKERPYATVYPRVTTKSNTYTVHYRVQLLRSRKPANDAEARVFDPARNGRVESEYRGSTTIERYIDPNEPGIPDFANDGGATAEPYYRFRVLLNKRFQG